jgi:hypothetical protein
VRGPHPGADPGRVVVRAKAEQARCSKGKAQSPNSVEMVVQCCNLAPRKEQRHCHEPTSPEGQRARNKNKKEQEMECKAAEGDLAG